MNIFNHTQSIDQFGKQITPGSFILYGVGRGCIGVAKALKATRTKTKNADPNSSYPNEYSNRILCVVVEDLGRIAPDGKRYNYWTGGAIVAKVRTRKTTLTNHSNVVVIPREAAAQILSPDVLELLEKA